MKSTKHRSFRGQNGYLVTSRHTPEDTTTVGISKQKSKELMIYLGRSQSTEYRNGDNNQG